MKGKPGQQSLQSLKDMHCNDISFISLFAAVLGSSIGHVTMKFPNNGGVDSEPAKQLCKGKRGKHDTPLRAGSSLKVELQGSATHEGGGCQFGLSYDNGQTFTLLMTTDDTCPITQTYDVPIPADAPSCTDCVFAWGWIPRVSGAPEYYMNCAEVQIQGGSGGQLNGPKMEIFNMPGFPSVHNDNPTKSKTLGLAERFASGASSGANMTSSAKDSETAKTAGNSSSSNLAPASSATPPNNSPDMAANTGNAPTPTISSTPSIGLNDTSDPHAPAKAALQRMIDQQNDIIRKHQIALGQA
jgi:hypothetical protein